MLQFVILEPNKVLLPINLPGTNKRKFYLCALCTFALKKCFLSFLALEKSKIAPQRREETQRKFYLFCAFRKVGKGSTAERKIVIIPKV
jgi:hypothetical protein